MATATRLPAYGTGTARRVRCLHMFVLQLAVSCGGVGMKRLVVATLAMLTPIMTSNAAERTFSDWTAAELYSACVSTDTVRAAQCRFFVLGVAHGIMLGRSTSNVPNVFCVPEGADATSMAALVLGMMRLLDRNYLELPAVSMVAAALNSAYPCPNAN
jgi:hypothetical protein